VWLQPGANRIFVLEMIQTRMGGLTFWADHGISYAERQGVA
jgi:hypothetical protein